MEAMKHLGWLGSALLVAGLAAAAFVTGRASAPKDAPPHIGVRATPGVITAIHDVARLEATVFHVEKVVEVDDAQSRLWGLVQPTRCCSSPSETSSQGWT